MPNPPLKDGVVAVLRDNGGRLLFIRRGLSLARAPGWWCFVGGQVEAGESLPGAMLREMREEAGLDIEVLGKVHESISPNGEFRLHWLEVRLTPDGQTVRPDPVEVAEARWLSAGEALMLDPLLPALRKWLEQQGARGEG